MSMNTEPHPTPDTDAFVLKWQNADPARALVELTELHRSKERELAESKAQVRVLRESVSELEKDVEFYRSSMTRVAASLGVVAVEELMVLAENNTETYVDCLLKYIAIRKPIAAAMATQH